MKLLACIIINVKFYRTKVCNAIKYKILNISIINKSFLEIKKKLEP